MGKDLRQMDSDVRIREIGTVTPQLVEQLTALWEKSVRATHLFLSDGEIRAIKGYIPQGLYSVSRLVVADEDGRPAAFMGIHGRKLEMLFVDSEHLGKGIGKQLLKYGIEKHGVREVTVNEQNPRAAGFYEHMGFKTYKRTDHDEQGGPYPILYMRLDEKQPGCLNGQDAAWRV